MVLGPQGCSLQKLEPVNRENEESLGGSDGMSSSAGTRANGGEASSSSPSGGGAGTRGGNPGVGGNSGTGGDPSTITQNAGGTSTTGGAAPATGGNTASNGGTTSGYGGTTNTGGTQTTAGTTGLGGCNPSMPFATPQQIVVNLDAAQGEHSMSVSADGLTAVVAVSKSGGNYQLKQYERASLSEMFMAQKALNGDANINTTGFVMTDPQLARDGLSLVYIASDAYGGRVAHSSRSSRAAAFGPWIDLNVYLQWSASPWVDAQRSVIYWVDGNSRMMQASASFAGTTPQFTNQDFVTGIHDPGPKESSFALTEDQLTLYFSSDRVVPFGNTSQFGRFRIWRATRKTTDEGWGALAVVDELDRYGTSVHPTDVSPDGCLLYFRLKKLDESEFHLYQATKPH
jgi:hypothetical protein